MAVVWKQERGDIRYEVRSAGHSLRLYTNGAFHSQYNSRRLLPGGVWDLLALPTLCPPNPARQALVLGVGGGACLRLLRALGTRAPARLIGIEHDPVHLQVARRFFGCRDAAIELIEADAIEWAKSSRRRFDLVIDDLFIHGTGDPERPDTIDDNWFETLVKRTSQQGALVQNHLTPAVARRFVRQHRSMIESEFSRVYLLDRPHYENGVLACFRDAVDRPRSLITRAITAIDATAARNLQFRCTRVF